jgi:hypothetical protein
MKKVALQSLLGILLLPQLLGTDLAQNNHGTPASQVIADFNFHGGALIDAIAELSSTPGLELHIGFEEIIRDRITDPRDRSIRFELHLVNRTVGQVLDDLCKLDPRYTWSTDGDSVNVFPHTIQKNPAYLMNLEIEEIGLSNVSNPDKTLKQLHVLFPAPQVGYMQSGGQNEYTAPWSVKFERLSVRQFINRIAEHMGPRTSWVWQGGQNERMFTFLKGGFHTESPKSNATQGSP